MSTRQQIMLGVLVVVIAYYFYDLFGTGDAGTSIPKQITRNQPKNAGTPVAQQVVKAGFIMPGSEGLSTKFSGDWGTDPFNRPALLSLLIGAVQSEYEDPAELDSSFVLTGIIGKTVIIGSGIYDIGDDINGYKLIEVGEAHAIIKQGNSLIRLKLGGNQIIE